MPRIDTGNSSSNKQRPYRTSAAEKGIIETEEQRMLKEDAIQLLNNHVTWSHPVLFVTSLNNHLVTPVILVKKENGEWHFYADYRWFNEVTKKDVYPLQRIDYALDCSPVPQTCCMISNSVLCVLYVFRKNESWHL